MENPQIAANMHLITLPEYLRGMLKSEDSAGELSAEEDEAMDKMEEHLEGKYCLYLQS